MIPLSSFDYRRVLDGARVPLRWDITDAMIASTADPLARRCLEDNQHARIEWCGNIGWREEGLGYPRQFFDSPSPTMSIDPTHPDVARLIDRRIMEAEGRTRAPIASAVLHLYHARMGGTASHFALMTLDADGCNYLTLIEAMRNRAAKAAIADLNVAPENIPVARAALLCALYPPEVK